MFVAPSDPHGDLRLLAFLGWAAGVATVLLWFVYTRPPGTYELAWEPVLDDLVASIAVEPELRRYPLLIPNRELDEGPVFHGRVSVRGDATVAQRDGLRICYQRYLNSGVIKPFFGAVRFQVGAGTVKVNELGSTRYDVPKSLEECAVRRLRHSHPPVDLEVTFDFKTF